MASLLRIVRNFTAWEFQTLKHIIPQESNFVCHLGKTVASHTQAESSLLKIVIFYFNTNLTLGIPILLYICSFNMLRKQSQWWLNIKYQNRNELGLYICYSPTEKVML